MAEKDQFNEIPLVLSSDEQQSKRKLNSNNMVLCTKSMSKHNNIEEGIRL